MGPARVTALVLAAGLVTAACGASAGPAPSSAAPGGRTGPASSLITLTVPRGEGGGALATPRQLQVPPGWTARVWARVPGARTPAVTLVGGFQDGDGSRWGRPADAVPGPGGALYVSDDTAGAIYRLMPPR